MDKCLEIGKYSWIDTRNARWLTLTLLRECGYLGKHLHYNPSPQRMLVIALLISLHTLSKDWLQLHFEDYINLVLISISYIRYPKYVCRGHL